MDNLKIKIDLSEIDYQNPTPIKSLKKKKKKVKEEQNKEHNDHHIKSKKKSAKKHSEKRYKSLGTASHEKPRNSANCLSLSLPLTETIKDITSYSKPSLRHWEERLVLVPNVFTYTKDIWLKKWVLVDGGDPLSDSKSYAQMSYSKYSRPYKDSQKKYVCNQEDCGKFFFEASALKKHQGIHGERLYTCQYDDCGKKFLDNSKLRRHQLVHTGEKPFKCDLCEKKFSLDFNLKTHLRTHTGEKPYICTHPGCEKRFTQSSNLTAHERTHKEMAANANPSTNTFTVTTFNPKPEKSGNEANPPEKKVLFTSVVAQEHKSNQNQVFDVVNEEHENNKEQPNNKEQQSNKEQQNQ